MTTGNKKTLVSYSTLFELDIFMQSCAEYEHVLRKKSNMAAAAKEHELMWQKTADDVNTQASTTKRNICFNC